MKRTFSRLLVGVVALLASMGSFVQAAQNMPVLKTGERMVFLGDSITEQRIHTRYVMDFFALRYPDMNVTFRNAGWGGDRSPGGLARLQRDVLSQKPNVVSICFGMNDGSYQVFDKNIFDTYITGMNGLISELKKAGVKVVLLTPGCIDQERYNWTPCKTYNDTLGMYADGVKDLAAKERLPVYDIHKLMLDVQTKAKAADASFTMIPDSVHPSPAGQALMAYGLISDLGAVSTASGLEIDAAKAEYVADRCTVKNLKITNDTVSFVRTDNALPTYFDPEVAGIEKFAPFLTDLNEYNFKVTGLKSGTWKLSVQGMEVGKFTSDVLANGIDLSNQPGPWKKLAGEVNGISGDQENLYFMRWRQIELLGLPAEAKRETDALLKKMDSLIAAKEAARAKAVANRTWEWSLKLEQ